RASHGPTRSSTNPGLQLPQDVNEAIEDGIRPGLSTIPVIGGFLATLIQVLWPWGNSNTDVWDSIKAQVEQLIDQKLEQQTYEAAILKLQALNSNMHDYLLDRPWIFPSTIWQHGLPVPKYRSSSCLLWPLSKGGTRNAWSTGLL